MTSDLFYSIFVSYAWILLDFFWFLLIFLGNLDEQGMKELQVSLFQTLVLLLFNTVDTLPFEQIKAATNVEVIKKTLIVFFKSFT